MPEGRPASDAAQPAGWNVGGWSQAQAAAWRGGPWGLGPSVAINCLCDLEPRLPYLRKVG